MSATKTRIGVINYATNAVMPIQLADFYSQERFKQELGSCDLTKTCVRIDNALRLANTKLFQPANGGRPTVRKVVIIVTDGMQVNNRDEIVAEAKKLHAAGVVVFVISIGPPLGYGMLRVIAGDLGRIIVLNNIEMLTSAPFLKKLSTDTHHAACKLKYYSPSVPTNIKGIALSVISRGGMHLAA